MKSINIHKSIFLGCLALGTLGLLTPTLSFADGKGASKLMPSATTSQTQLQAASRNVSHMSCCTDRYTQAVDQSAKGMRAGSTKMVPTHACTSCQTKITSVGVGKAKTDNVSHSCGSNATAAAASCCVATK
jgi:hypothetical protein